MKKIAVIIVTYNSELHIYDCLDSIFKYNDIGDALEIIVVDNCSKGYEAMASSLSSMYGNKIELIQNTKNGGYGQGNNVGIRVASAPLIMIMNPDVRLCEPVFEMVNSVFEDKSDVLMYSLTQRNEQGVIGRSTSWTFRVHPYIAEPLRFLLGKLNVYWQKYMYFSGACFFVRKSAFEAVGLFDEHIFMYNEEDDIHGRLMKQKGARIIYDKKHSYIHLHPNVTDYSVESYDWLKRDLASLIYLNERDGIPREKTIKWAIKRTNISVWSEKLKKMLGKGNEDRIKYYIGWRKIQREMLNKQD